MENLKKFFKQTFSSLKIPNYRLYFMGQAISQCGTWMQAVTEDLLILKLSGSGLQLGLITAAQFLPVLLLSPITGVIVDRFNKRKLIYFTQIAFGLQALILGFLVVSGEIRLWMVYVLASCYGIVTSIDSPTRQTFIFEMV